MLRSFRDLRINFKDLRIKDQALISSCPGQENLCTSYKRNGLGDRRSTVIHLMAVGVPAPMVASGYHIGLSLPHLPNADHTFCSE